MKMSEFMSEWEWRYYLSREFSRFFGIPSIPIGIPKWYTGIPFVVY